MVCNAMRWLRDERSESHGRWFDWVGNGVGEGILTKYSALLSHLSPAWLKSDL